jgi:hypothetical protein
MQGKKPLFGLTFGADEASARATDFSPDFCDLPNITNPLANGIERDLAYTGKPGLS